ncbi:MAG TPA: hypothetical protein VFV38_07760 [Ktedonobacteraceae bacterium]|nr:hypothetical protein [Ktedonobacteraceae bacterium]
MVNIHSTKLNHLNYIVKEQTLVAKTGNPENNEDLIHISPSFVAVIDGTTSKTSRLWDGKTGGQVCAHIIDHTLSQISGDASAEEVIGTITANIKDFYKNQGVLALVEEEPSQRVTAALVVVSLQRREIWFVGDCQCMLDNQLIRNEKPVDIITAEARAMFLETELQKGVTIEELRRNDAGREFILPLLKQQQLFQNNPAAGVYWYPIIDGFPVPDGGIRIEAIPETAQTIILASDGYPILRKTLEASEKELQYILENDPLLFRTYKATKGVQEGFISYDDRAYIRLKIYKHQKHRNVSIKSDNSSESAHSRRNKKRTHVGSAKDLKSRIQ